MSTNNVAETKYRAPRNRTTTVSDVERTKLRQKLLHYADMKPDFLPLNSTIHGDMLQCVTCLPSSSVDLLILDPPYNLNKQFNTARFPKRDLTVYADWMETWFVPLLRVLKPTASIYICSDWSTSPAVHGVVSEHAIIRNRITWEREKGRGALRNWKNCSEDIWFCTTGDEFTFNADAVRLKRRVVAPYRSNGLPKGWHEDISGQYRMTSPSNLWTDITVPFWSMPENTDHPTQKPEKLIAKLLLASSTEGDVVLDPFLGSGTTSVVCKKLNRRYIGIELDEEYCLLAEKRLASTEIDRSIQGYEAGGFLERNTLALQMQQTSRHKQEGLFGNET